jgi:Ring finger domain
MIAERDIVVQIAREAPSPEDIEGRHRAIQRRRADDVAWRFQVILLKLPLIVASAAVLATTWADNAGDVCMVDKLTLWNWLLVRACWTAGVDVLWQGWERWRRYRRLINNQHPRTSWIAEQWSTIRFFFPFIWLVVGLDWYRALQDVPACDSALLKMTLAYCVLDVVTMVGIVGVACCCLPCALLIMVTLDKPTGAKPMTAAEIEQTVKDERFQPAEGVEGITCSICLDDMIAEEIVMKLPACAHTFHAPCIRPWLAIQGNCPNCRTALVPQKE